MSTFLIIAGVSYVSFCLLFYFGQHYFFFRPEILPKHFNYEYAFPFSERTFSMPDGGEINAVHFEVPNSRGVVYYLKGNSRSIKGWGKFAKDFLGKGYDFFMMDYRGFGKSTGRRSERQLYDDARYIYDLLCAQYREDTIVIYGRSFGAGIAANCATAGHPRMLILDSPYYTFRYEVGRFLGWLPLRWLLKYKMPTVKYLKELKCPAYIIHGDKDYIISYAQGVRLSEETPAELLTIRGARHNNLPEFKQYHDALYKLLTANRPHSERSGQSRT